MKNVVIVALLVIAMVLGGTACSDKEPPDGQADEGPADGQADESPPVRQAWVATWGGDGSRGCGAGDVARDVAVDAWGNVCMTGDVCNGYSFDYITVKYDSSGKVLWSRTYDGPNHGSDSAEAMAVDASGNVYVTGGSSDGPGMGWELDSDYDFTTIKYAADGTQLWVARYEGMGFFNDTPSAIALDEAGNVYVTGESGRAGPAGMLEWDYATIKYAADGTQLWAARYHGSLPGPDDGADDIAVGADGSVFVTGHSAGRVRESDGYSATVSDYATIKYDASGTQLWVARYSDPGGGDSYVSALALDSAGNAFVAGASENPDSEWEMDYLTVKYDGAGNQLWAARYDVGEDMPTDIAVDARGNACVTGTVWRFSFIGGGGGLATVKYDAQGNRLWAHIYGSRLDDEEGQAVALDASGNAYVTGHTSQYQGDNEALDVNSLTIKYDADGPLLWKILYDGEGEGGNSASAIALDSAGNVYVAGYSETTSLDTDCLTIKYEPV